ncbi:hypothetical protein [Anaerorhabdus sp.]|uniref:alpha/beta hydrolase family protein n=1 Tax=Anaerorhabdus sp. TaxID=1872524 RepID=UPI002B1EA573|nr:hypothetical protein [Anaerorhabdus sp.]MEA4874658.1 hypothetical protein [Anaerorhabdus sp.]
MKTRSLILLSAIILELLFIIYCVFQKSNRVPLGYICAFLSFILLICTGWLLLFPKVPLIETTGKYDISEESTFYKDTKRVEIYTSDGSYRELPVTFWYPQKQEENQKYPLILFSHGSFGVKESNLTLYRELASHGYIVVSIDHTYQCFSTKLSNGKTVRVSSEFMKEIASENPQKKPEESFIHFKKWMDIRSGDINLVLDTIIENVSNKSKELDVYKYIDTTQIGLIGHSLGGSAVLGVGRQRDDISAVISLEAPFLADIKSVDEKGNFIFEQSDYPIPVLNIYSDASWKNLRNWKQYEENAKLLDIESETIQNVYLKGIGHFSLTDLSLSSPFLTMLLDGGHTKNNPQETLIEINEICLSFLNKFMKK